jgi:hypothetical protein
MSKYTLVLDSSQISEFLECQQKWYFKYVKHLVPTFIESQDSLPMNAGTYGHKLLDIYYRARYARASLNDAAARAFAYNPDTDTCECGCSLDSHKFIPQLNIQECHRCTKCFNFKPKPFSLDMGTRIAVQNRVREYFFTYQSNDFQIESIDHVEVGFSEVIFEDDENLFVLEGRIDLLASLQGMQCVVDHKFQMRRHQLYPKSIQFRNYALVAKKLLFIINYIRLTKTPDGTTLVRELVNFTVPELLAWKQKLIQIFHRVKLAKQLGDLGGVPEQNFGACPGRFNYMCNFTTLCEEPQQEVARLKEQQLYKINANPWRPW